MKTMSKILLLWLLTVPALAQNPPPSTDTFVVGITGQGNQLKVGTPENINNREGYDNQPSFLPDGNSILYTSTRNGGATDIYHYNLRTRIDKQVTNTPEGEYSATVMPGGKTFSVIRVEADGTQRLWKFPLEGGTPSLVLETIKPVGYQAWFDDKTLLLFVLGSPATIQLVDVPSEKAVKIADNAGRSLHRIPGQSKLSFTHKVSPQEWFIESVDPKTRQTARIVKTLPAAEDYAWMPDGKTILMGKGSKLYRWNRAQGDEWQEVADFAGAGVQEITRLATSPKGDRLAFVASLKKPSVRVVVETEFGDIEADIDVERAPVTAANFLKYVDGGFFLDSSFSRTVTPDNQPNDAVKIEVIQTRLNTAMSGKGFPAIPLERTSVTGILHKDGTLSMARGGPDSATSSFFICVNDQPSLDFAGKRNADGQGFAAFGQVVKGMDVVKKIQMSPADVQNLKPPIKIVNIRRK